MDITPSTIYWITRLGIFRECFIVAFVISLVAVLISLIGTQTAEDEYDKKFVRWLLKRGIVVCAFAFVGVLFCPSTKEMAAMYVIPAVVNNEKVQNLGNGMYDLALEWMASLKPSKKVED